METHSALYIYAVVTILPPLPNYPPPATESFWSQVDQTRGLLSYVNDNFPGAYHKNLKYTSVLGTGTPGKLGGGIEESVAYISYLPLCGKGESVGDGIIPESIAFLEGAVHVRVPEAKHSSFIPTAGPSIKVPGYIWYGSPEVLDQWLVELPEGTKTKALSKSSSSVGAPFLASISEWGKQFSLEGKKKQ